jgi:hypothetical protein
MSEVATANIYGIILSDKKELISYPEETELDKIKRNLLNTYLENNPETKYKISNNFKPKEKFILNKNQEPLYRDLIYGLKDYENKQISPFRRKEIIENYSKAKRRLILLKLKAKYKLELKLMNLLFPGQKIGFYDNDWDEIEIPKVIKKVNETGDRRVDYIEKEITLADVGITMVDIINEFIQSKLLPSNFYEL